MLLIVVVFEFADMSLCNTQAKYSGTSTCFAVELNNDVNGGTEVI